MALTELRKIDKDIAEKGHLYNSVYEENDDIQGTFYVSKDHGVQMIESVTIPKYSEDRDALDTAIQEQDWHQEFTEYLATGGLDPQNISALEKSRKLVSFLDQYNSIY